MHWETYLDQSPLKVLMHILSICNSINLILMGCGIRNGFIFSLGMAGSNMLGKYILQYIGVQMCDLLLIVD